MKISNAVVIATIVATAGVGCGDDAVRTTSSTSSAATSSSAGSSSSGAGGTSASASSTSSSTSSSSASASSSTGAGGSGGAPIACLDPSATAAYFKLEAQELCAIAVYDAADPFEDSDAPTWGAHGGPLLVHGNAMDGSVDLVRWTPPMGAMGSLTKSTTHVDAMIPTKGSFLGAQAVDLPFFGWTALSWTGSFPATQGELLLVAADKVDRRYAVNGIYAIAGIGAANDEGRVLYSGLSRIDDASASENGFFAADSCGTKAASPRLEPMGDATCAAPAKIVAWGDASGPIAIDAAGNALAIATTFSGSQEARGFAASTIARGAAPATGDTLFDLPGFGASLAAIAPSGKDPGLMLFQPYDATTFEPIDAILQRYDASATHVTPQGPPTVALRLVSPATRLLFFLGDQGRVWVGVADSAAKVATYVVLSRVP